MVGLGVVNVTEAYNMRDVSLLKYVSNVSCCGGSLVSFVTVVSNLVMTMSIQLFSKEYHMPPRLSGRPACLDKTQSTSSKADISSAQWSSITGSSGASFRRSPGITAGCGTVPKLSWVGDFGNATNVTVSSVSP